MENNLSILLRSLVQEQKCVTTRSSLGSHLWPRAPAAAQRALKNCQRGAANRKKELLYIQMRLRRCKRCAIISCDLFSLLVLLWQDICAAFMAIVTFIIYTSLDVQNVINEQDLIDQLI
jgi:hypothetical protein